jgi:hypothetical protein
MTGTTHATVTAGTLSGLVNGETLSVSGEGTFASENVAYSGSSITSQNVSVVYTLADGTGLASNYSLGGETLTATINPKALTVTGTTAADKVYDGNTTATITNVGTLSGFIDDETVTATATGLFDSKNVNIVSGQVADRDVTASFTLANGTNGGLAGNYILADVSGIAAAITPKEITIDGATVDTRAYNGGTTATISVGGASFTGMVGSEDLNVTATGEFDSRHVGRRTTTVTYTLSDDSASGGLASNYTHGEIL